MRKIRPYILIILAIAVFIIAGYSTPEPNLVTSDVSLKEVAQGFDIIDKYTTPGVYALWSAITLMLVCIVVCVSVVKGRVKVGTLGKTMWHTLVYLLILTLIGYLIAWITALVNGYDYHLFHAYPSFINDIFITGAAVILIAVVSILFFLRKRRKERDKISETSVRKSAASSGELKFDFRILCADLVVSLILAALAYIFSIPNYFILLPIFAVCVSMILWRIIRWRGILLVGIITIMLCIFGFGYTASCALSIGGMGIILPIVFLLFGMLLPLCDIYCRKEKNIK
jgi:hypothetical protein